ncbi:MAG: type II toxin-antitoxin system RelE/ParE family toxin [Xanthobacteraceae bacterium]|jgi:plasmid stabilization system protein ParE
MKVEYTRQALADLLYIAAYIRGRNRSAAVDLENAIRSTIGLLVDFPKLGRDRPGLGVRALSVSRYPYTAYYRIVKDEVWIVHIRDDRRKPPESSDL